MIDERTVIGTYDDEEDEPIILPIPYDDENAERARQRAAELARMRDNAPDIVSLNMDEGIDAEISSKTAAAEQARKAAEAAAAAAAAAEKAAADAVQAAEAAARKKAAAEAAAEAAQAADMQFDDNGDCVVRIVVPKDYDLVFTFKPKAK